MIRVERDFDAKRINAIINHPYVRPDVEEVAEGPLDFSNILADQRNVCLMGEYGGIMFIKTMVGVYEAHSQALPEGRGTWIRDFLCAACDWIYTRTDAFEITTRIPVEHHGAIRLATAAGGKPEFERENGVVWRGKRQKVLIYSYRIQDWAKITDSFDQAGRDFHDFLHAEAARIGFNGYQHPDDPNHNRYLGISLAMLDAGLVWKGLNFFNRWAILAREPLVKLTSNNPLTIQIDFGNLIFENGTKRVEPLQVAA